jgi:lipoate-protein ligase A
MALVGRHQALSREVKLTTAAAIGYRRRITGGGAIYFDEGQLGWELVFGRATLGIASLGDLAREICEAAAAGLRRLGVNAKYRPRNDIEVDGRKISGTGGFFDEDTLFYQGTVLVDMNPADMVAALNVPEAKLAKRALDSAAQRVVTLKELLGRAPEIDAIKSALLAGFAERLGITPVPGQITVEEESLATKYHDEEIGTDEFVAEIDDPGALKGALVYTGAGGTITAYVRLEAAERPPAGSSRFSSSRRRTVFDLKRRCGTFWCVAARGGAPRTVGLLRLRRRFATAIGRRRRPGKRG